MAEAVPWSFYISEAVEGAFVWGRHVSRPGTRRAGGPKGRSIVALGNAQGIGSVFKKRVLKGRPKAPSIHTRLSSYSTSQRFKNGRYSSWMVRHFRASIVQEVPCL